MWFVGEGVGNLRKKWLSGIVSIRPSCRKPETSGVASADLSVKPRQNAHHFIWQRNGLVARAENTDTATHTHATHICHSHYIG